MGILTEEELKENVSYIMRNNSIVCRDVSVSLLKKIETSHIELLSANAALSFKNQNLKGALIDISTHVGNFTSTQFFNDAYTEVKKLAHKALEEIK